MGESGEFEAIMFIGEYKHNLDDKSRLAIPAKFRSQLKSGGVVTKGVDNCLFFFPKKEWTVLAPKIASTPFTQANPRAFARLMFGNAMDVTLDKQGRIVLPDYLIKYAGLKREVIIAGLYNRLEIWDENSWVTYKANAEKQSEEIAEKMGALGI